MTNDLTKVLPYIIKYKALLVLVAVLSVCGYTAYQISAVVAVTSDPQTVAEEQDKVDATRIKFDTQTIDAIVKQNQVNVAPDLTKLGTSNPFFSN